MNPVNDNKLGFSNINENNPLFDIFLNISEIKNKEKSILELKHNNDFTVSALLIQNQI